VQAIIDLAHAQRTARTRLVMLPAAYTAPQDFVIAGFVTAVRERQLDIDLAFAGLELQHVSDRTVIARISRELLEPARVLGCTVWLGGISLGGFIALSCAERHPQLLDGLCVFAPYLGSHIVTSEIVRARGVAGWQPGELAEDDEERRIWRFIKTQPTRGLPLHLGLGREDRFAARHRLMAAALPPADVDIVPGGHDWPTWRTLWDNFLDERFVRTCPHA
jgi:pimeloyl-ACP methyl ester carboxylesterase